MTKRKLCALLLAAGLMSTVILGGCGGDDSNSKTSAVSTAPVVKSNIPEDGGFKTVSYESSKDKFRTFYEIFPYSFYDSDGNGKGDLKGITQHLDYLNDGDPKTTEDLGIDGIWLTPIFKSPSYHKYDVTDYYSVDSRFGTLEDLQALVDLCHERGVKLILDLPINHTDEYYNFYSFVTPGSGGAPGGYRQIGSTGDWYECNFDSRMPELNFDSEAVRAELVKVAKFYLDMGVDGFRFDAAKYVYLNDNRRSGDFWDWYLARLKAIKPDLYTVAEVWDSDGVTDEYYSAVNCFNFTTSQTNGLIAATAQHGNVNAYTAYVDAYLDRIHAIRSDAMIVPFISNHDNDRASGYLTVASGNMKVAANLYLLSSGSPFIYYGEEREELGMRGSRGGSNTDANRRLAMLWGDGDKVKDPAGATYPASKQIETTAADQMADEGSLYNYYKKVLMIRAAHPAIARGDYTALSLEGTKLGGFVADWEGQRVCVLHNTTLSGADLDLNALGLSAFTKLSAFVGVEDASLSDGVLHLGSQTSAVLVTGA